MSLSSFLSSSIITLSLLSITCNAVKIFRDNHTNTQVLIQLSPPSPPPPPFPCNVALCLPAFYLFECDCIKLVVSSSKHAADQGTWVKGLTFSHSQQQDDPHPRLHPRHGGWAGCFPAITLSHQTALLTIQPARRVEPLRCAAFEPLCRTDRPSGSWGWWWGLLAEAQKTHMRVGIADRKVFTYCPEICLGRTSRQTQKFWGNYQLSRYCLESFWPSSKGFWIGLKNS